ncbi:MAG TPA: GDSL-type esterase/lipase family protein [Chloroflexota bacterium]|nr:GDSL-type esterase/lipase family protein [Chloroflexota bacterium]
MERRRISWFVMGLLALALLLQPAAAGAQAPQRGVYLALGDSLAYGVGATDPARLGYVPRLFEFFHGTAHAGVDTLVNKSVSGETSTSLINGGQLAAAIAEINMATDIRVVTLDIGGNDLLALLAPGSPCLQDPNGPTCQQALATALATFASNYASILTQLTAALANDPGDEKIIIMTYYNHLSGTGSPFEPVLDAALLGTDRTINCATAPTTWGIDDIITCLPRQLALPGVTVADVYPRFVGKGRTLTHVSEGGDFHPTNAGYAMIANAFMDASR